MENSYAETTNALAGKDSVSAVLDAALERFRTLDAYQASIRSEHDEGTDVILYRYKRPGFVRIDCVEPHRGTVLIYDCTAQRVRLWPFGTNASPPIVLRPDNRLIKGRTGQRIDRSDIGTLLQEVSALLTNGRGEVLDDPPNPSAQRCRLRVSGERVAASPRVARYELGLDRERGIPFEVISYDPSGRRIEKVTLDAVEIDPEFPADVFYP